MSSDHVHVTRSSLELEAWIAAPSADGKAQRAGEGVVLLAPVRHLLAHKLEGQTFQTRTHPAQQSFGLERGKRRRQAQPHGGLRPLN